MNLTLTRTHPAAIELVPDRDPARPTRKMDVLDSNPIATATLSDRGEPLLPGVARGEREAINACIKQYRGLVWSLARRVLGHGPEAEDAVQEIFIELWQKADRYDPSKGKEATFIAVLTRRRLIDKLRRAGARPDGRPAELSDAAVPVSDADSPIAQLELTDEVRCVHEAMAELKPPQPEVLRLAVCDGLTHQQVAERLELPLGTVKSHVRRGLIRLREVLSANAKPGVTA
ncbi:MAG: sigma-70 family RNA polymerase sigma factor [Planctomycetota bacterium]